MDVSTMFFETQALMPSWRDHFKAEDQTPSYEYLRTVLQVLQWLRGGTRWVLKSPQHLEQFGPLVATFPDATFVVTHRDPASVTVSMATMIAYTARMTLRRVDPVAIGDYWSARCEDLFRACAARPGPAPRRPVDRRGLRRLHGRRHRHGREDLHRGGPALHRRVPARHGRVHGGAPPRSARHRRLPARRARHRPRRASPGPALLHPRFGVESEDGGP